MRKIYTTIFCILFISQFLNLGTVFAKITKPIGLYYFTDTLSARKSLVDNINKIDIFAPQTYGINKFLIPHGGINKDTEKIIANHKIKIMPLITNDGFSQYIIHNLLTSNIAQDNVINFMITEAKKNNFYGWQFDLEHIPSSDKILYTNFIEKTNDLFKKNNLVLSVAVIVRTDNSTTTNWYRNWSGVFDYKNIANNSDFISIMTYDDPDSKGPTAPLPFVIKALNYIIKDGVQPQKISLGIPDYYWSWTTYPRLRRLRSGSYERLLSIERRVNYTQGFDNYLGVPWISFEENRIKYNIWYENQESFKLKFDLVDKYNLQGFSMWVMGIEDPSIWNIL